MANDAGEKEHKRPHGPARQILRLLVEVDSSRFIGTRLGAGIGLLGLLGLFGAAGYWLPALVSRYLAR